jgi:hypothetical protein
MRWKRRGSSHAMQQVKGEQCFFLSGVTCLCLFRKEEYYCNARLVSRPHVRNNGNDEFENYLQCGIWAVCAGCVHCAFSVLFALSCKAVRFGQLLQSSDQTVGRTVQTELGSQRHCRRHFGTHFGRGRIRCTSQGLMML